MRQHAIELQHGRSCLFAEFADEEADLFQSCPSAHRPGICPISSDDFHRHGADGQRRYAVAQRAPWSTHSYDEQVHECGEPERPILVPANDRLPWPWSPGYRRLESELDNGSRQFFEPAERLRTLYQYATGTMPRQDMTRDLTQEEAERQFLCEYAMQALAVSASPAGNVIYKLDNCQGNAKAPRFRIAHADPTFTQGPNCVV